VPCPALPCPAAQPGPGAPQTAHACPQGPSPPLNPPAAALQRKAGRWGGQLPRTCTCSMAASSSMTCLRCAASPLLRCRAGRRGRAGRVQRLGLCAGEHEPCCRAACVLLAPPAAAAGSRDSCSMQRRWQREAAGSSGGSRQQRRQQQEAAGSSERRRVRALDSVMTATLRLVTTAGGSRRVDGRIPWTAS
jgi:hypothetical protein